MSSKLPFFRRYLLVLLENLAPNIPIPDKLYLKIKFYCRMGKRLNLKNPQTFNEKLQWLKLYGRRPIDTVLSDKYAVKEYITKTIGPEYVIPLLGVWDKFDDIDFDKLPNQFVLKCTHDSGGIVICKDKSKMDKKAAKKKLEKSLMIDYYVYSREKAYKNIPRRIIAEQYMEDAESSELKDYKFFCFDGEVKFFKIDFGRFVEHRANYYTPQGELLALGEEKFPPNPNAQVVVPKNLETMVELAEKLSKGKPFVRVDFYDVANHIYFGEFTFSPGCGMNKLKPEGWDEKIGEWIKLDK